MAATSPVAAFSLSSAELAVLVDLMSGGRLLDSSSALADFQIDESGREATEEQLLDRGLLISLPFEAEAGVTTQLATVLGAALSPDQVCIVRTVRQEHTDPPVIFSFTGSSIVRNTVAPEGQHEFEQLADLDAALDGILAAGGALEAPSPKRGAKPRPLAELLDSAARMVLLMIAVHPDAPDTDAGSLAWVQNDEGLWLVDPASNEEDPAAKPVSVGTLKKRIAAELEA